MADSSVRAMADAGAYVLKEHELKRLERVIFREMGPPNKPGVINPAWIGKNAGVILPRSVSRRTSDIRCSLPRCPTTTTSCGPSR